MLQAFSTVIREEGLLALWKGNLSATFLWVSYMAVQFTMYGVLKRIGEATPNPFDRQPRQNTVGDGNDGKTSGAKAWKALVLFLAGAGAGITAIATTYPFDIMRTQFALQGTHKVYHSMGDFIGDTYRNRGVRGFYAGLTPAVIGITPQMGLNFALYESFKLLVTGDADETSSQRSDGNAKKKDSLFKSTVLKGFCGGAAGGISKLIVYPLDTVKKRLQAQVLKNTMSATVQTLRYDGFLHCFKTIYATEGVPGFYRGLVATTAKAVASTAVTFAAYEAAKELLDLRQRDGDQEL